MFRINKLFTFGGKINANGRVGVINVKNYGVVSMKKLHC